MALQLALASVSKVSVFPPFLLLQTALTDLNQQGYGWLHPGPFPIELALWQTHLSHVVKVPLWVDIPRAWICFICKPASKQQTNKNITESYKTCEKLEEETGQSICNIDLKLLKQRHKMFGPLT